jgi:guanylate kinase
MINIKSDGILLILSSPSGAGKTTIARAIADKDRKTQLSTSCTTRAKRSNESDGKDYYFVEHDVFLDMVAEDQFLEYAIIYDHLYGTPKDKIIDHINNGTDVIFDIDWQGAASIKKQLPENVVSIFILPPSLETLKKRLKSRSSDNEIEIEKRFKEAIHEISHYRDYDFVVVNDNLDKAIDEVYAILKAERLRRSRRKGIASFIEKM